MKPIKIDESVYEDILNKAKEAMKKAKLSNGSFTFNYSFKSDDSEKANLYISPTAYIKMTDLVSYIGSEVGWHGTAYRGEDGYHVTDVFMYPQTVSAATVETDQKEYEDWLQTLDDDTFNNMRFHGHSHVDMITTPSSVDMHDRDGILSQLGPDDFYIFVILNKKGSWNVAIYDMSENKMYETDDINVLVEGCRPDTFEFAELAEKCLKKKTYGSTTPVKQYNNNYQKNNASPAWARDDDDDYYGNGYYSKGWKGYY